MQNQAQNFSTIKYIIPKSKRQFKTLTKLVMILLVMAFCCDYPVFLFHLIANLPIYKLPDMDYNIWD